MVDYDEQVDSQISAPLKARKVELTSNIIPEIPERSACEKHIGVPQDLEKAFFPTPMTPKTERSIVWNMKKVCIKVSAPRKVVRATILVSHTL